MKERGNTVAVIGGGGRETTLIREYSKSPYVDNMVAIPGNDWMKKISEKPVKTFPDIKTSDTVKIATLCKELGVNLVDVAQDNAVKKGIVNMLNYLGIPAVGATSNAGRIEWSKSYARDVGDFLKLSQPQYAYFSRKRQAEDFLDSHENRKWFVKADGLAEGKGAVSATSKQEVLNAISWLQKEYPEAATTFLIEEWLRNEDGSNGEEFSAFAISDGKNSKILGYVQDHKRECDGDKGDNTGGMGAVSHPLLITPELTKQTEEIFKKTLIYLRDSGTEYKGILYLGGMVVDGKIYIIEFNARWGDPEAQVIVPGLKVDLFEMGMETAKGRLRKNKISDDGKVRVAVAGVAKGYPRTKEYIQVKGKQIFGLDETAKIDGVTIIGAAVKIINGKHYVDGGRLFYVVAEGQDVLRAREKADEALERIRIEGNNLHFRKDIGWRDVQRLTKRTS
jgi:phosphoribosylamine---glycine ligase